MAYMGRLLTCRLMPTPCSFSSLCDEPALVPEEKCRMGRIASCTHEEFLESVSEATRLRQAWWIQGNRKEESGLAFERVTNSCHVDPPNVY